MLLFKIALLLLYRITKMEYFILINLSHGLFYLSFIINISKNNIYIHINKTRDFVRAAEN